MKKRACLLLCLLWLWLMGCSENDPYVKVTGVSLDKNELELVEGDCGSLRATVEPQNATSPGVTWSSDNMSVATVDAEGGVTALKAGTATVTATADDGGKRASCRVTVTAVRRAVTGVSLDKASLSLMEGNSIVLKATVSPANATDRSVSWTSDNTAVATVDINGKVTAVAVGKARITVTTSDGGKTAICEVTVSKLVIAVTGVSLNKPTLSLEAGESETLVATLTPDNATDKSLVWSSDRPAVATVDANGTVTARASGTANITVVAAEGDKSASCLVTVTDRTITAGIDAEFAKELQQRGYIKSAGQIFLSEVAAVRILDLSCSESAPGSLTSLKGIGYFSSLEELRVAYQKLTSLDLGDNKKLVKADVSHNPIIALNVSGLAGLADLNVSGNNLSALNLDGCIKLRALAVDCPLVSFDSALPALEELSLKNTVLTALNLGNCPNLKNLRLTDNAALASLDISGCGALESLYVSGGKLASLNISTNTKLSSLQLANLPGNSTGKFVVTVWSGFSPGATIPIGGTTWLCDGKTVMLYYREK